jgi:hypothetical protein
MVQKNWHVQAGLARYNRDFRINLFVKKNGSMEPFFYIFIILNFSTYYVILHLVLFF